MRQSNYEQNKTIKIGKLGRLNTLVVKSCIIAQFSITHTIFEYKTITFFENKTIKIGKLGRLNTLVVKSCIIAQFSITHTIFEYRLNLSVYITSLVLKQKKHSKPNKSIN